MNKFEAIAAMRKGLTVQHSSFSYNEWVREYDSGRYEFEDGCRCDKDEFWKYRTETSWDRGWVVVDDVYSTASSDKGEPILIMWDEITDYYPHESTVIPDALKSGTTLSNHLNGRGLLDIESMLHGCMLSNTLKSGAELMKEFNDRYTGILPTCNYKPVPPGCNGMKKPVQFHRGSWRRK